MTARTEARQWTTADVCSVRGCDEIRDHDGDHVQYVASLPIRDAAGRTALVLVTRTGPGFAEFRTQVHVTWPGGALTLTPTREDVKQLHRALGAALKGDPTW